MKAKLIFHIKFSKKDLQKGLKLPLRLSNDLAYLVGIFAGDGNMHHRQKKYEYSLKCVGNPFDEKKLYHEIIAPKFKKIFGFYPSINYFDKKTTYGFRIYSKALVIFLNKITNLPISKKYNFLKIPLIFLKRKSLITNFIRGVFYTDGCISFKKTYKKIPHYPVISLSSKSANFIKEISNILKKWGFKIYERYNYKVKDKRNKKGFTIISKIELSGHKNLKLWIEKINFFSPKHLEKIRKYEKK